MDDGVVFFNAADHYRLVILDETDQLTACGYAMLATAIKGLFSRRIIGSCLKTGQHSIFVIIRKIKKTVHVCWIPYLLMILQTLCINIFINGIVIIGNKKFKQYLWYEIKRYTFYRQ